MHKSSGKVAALCVCLAGSAAAQSGTYSNIQEYPLVGGNPFAVTAGPDGALWFTQANCSANCVGSITTGGVVTAYGGNCVDGGGIAAGSDGALWFTEASCSAIGRITTAGVIAQYPLPKAGSWPVGICAGPDGALWFAEAMGNRIGRIDTGGNITEYAVPTYGAYPGFITAGPDGALWFSEESRDNIGRITTAGAIEEYPIPTPLGDPLWITEGPDGALWFTQPRIQKIGRISTTGTITEFNAPNSGSGIAAGADGALWFAAGNGIGRMTTAGLVTEYAAPTADSGPDWVAAGPDGALWFTEWSGHNIGRAPACGLGLSARFAHHTLTMNFALGIDTPATWNVTAGPFEINRPIRAVVPPKPLTLKWRDLPNRGDVEVKSTLSDSSGQALCSEWTTVATGK